MRRTSAVSMPVEQALSAHEPAPAPGKLAVWPLVIADMKARDEIGRERYGTPLETENGRNALVDAYQEQLDHVVYLRQLIEEKGFDVLPLPPRHKLAAEVDRLRAREQELLESNSKFTLRTQEKISELEEKISFLEFRRDPK